MREARGVETVERDCQRALVEVLPRPTRHTAVLGAAALRRPAPIPTTNDAKWCGARGRVASSQSDHRG